MECVKDADKAVRDVASNTLTFLIQKVGLPNSLDVIKALASCLVEDKNFDKLDGAFSTIDKICEDATEAITNFRNAKFKISIYVRQQGMPILDDW